MTENTGAYENFASSFVGEGFPAYDERVDFVSIWKKNPNDTYEDNPHEYFYEKLMDYINLYEPTSFEPYRPFLKWILKNLHNKGTLNTIPSKHRRGIETFLWIGINRAIGSRNPEVVEEMFRWLRLAECDEASIRRMFVDSLRCVETSSPDNVKGAKKILKILSECFPIVWRSFESGD